MISDDDVLALARAVYAATGGKEDDWRRGQKVSTIQIAIRDGQDGTLAMPRRRAPGPTDLHKFVPDRKYPWFCSQCGYGPDERLRHFPGAAP